MESNNKVKDSKRRGFRRISGMEFSRFQDMVIKSEPQSQPMFLSDFALVRMADGMDYYLIPGESAEQSGEHRLLMMDDHGVLREISSLLSHSLPVYTADDTEIPAHVLDHMYAKKPREPGSELAPSKPRRRAKRKEQAVEQFIIPDSLSAAPKINIIRQRLPSTVYESLSSRPKILHGGGGNPQKSSSASGISNSSLPASHVKGKAATSKHNVHLGRTSKKDESSKKMYAAFDEMNKPFPLKTSFGSTNKLGKDHGRKTSSSKVTPNSSAIIMDDLQRVGAAYEEEEMLFDFGITEDDETIPGTLGSDGFSDGDFDEFGVGMEVYNTSNQGSLKSSCLSKSPITTSGILLNHRPQLKPSTHPQLHAPEISDDEDSNQIMVSIHNRRPSQDWDSVQLFEQSIKQDTEICQSLTDLCANNNKTTVLPSCEETDNKSSIEIEFKHSICLEDESNTNCEFQPEKDFLFDNPSAAAIYQDSRRKSGTDKLSPTRRSNRVIKTPAWLEDSDKIPIARRQRKKSST